MADAAGVVLAGGRSSRMGTPKAALEWHVAHELALNTSRPRRALWVSLPLSSRCGLEGTARSDVTKAASASRSAERPAFAAPSGSDVRVNDYPRRTRRTHAVVERVFWE